MNSSRTIRFLFAAIAVAFFTSQEARADGGPMNRTFGLGLELGVPTGITGKVFFAPMPALAFGLGTLLPFGGLGAWADLDLHFIHFHTRKDNLLIMSLYAGPGVAIGWSGNYYYTTYYRGAPVASYTVYGGAPELTIHGPFGFAIHWQRVAFDTFFEISPGVSIIPVDGGGAFFSIGGAIGGRYYF